YFKKYYENDIVKYSNEDKMLYLKKLVAPFILRRNKKDVLTELPDKIETTQIIPFNDEESKIYYASLAQANEELQALLNVEVPNKIAILSLLTRLRQLCCEPRIVYENIHNVSSKMKATVDLILNFKENHQKVLLFSSFTSVLDLLEEELKLQGISYYTLTGSTKKEERRNLVSQFQNDDTDVFLISLKAGGTGLNLTAASAVIHYDPWWNISAQNQATDRAYRIGQNKNVQVFYMVMKGSIEEKIIDLQKQKKELADIFVEGNDVNLSQMSKEELLELFS
ncbi:MAG: DEAD/DEAH box helicase, partial [Erysipelotrichaceae bacterium]|nr:DEAD/DEAH box helicase [Erysipelotrichaceae bacterium]